MEYYNIYPKQFRNAKIPIEKNRCFILMPFDSKFDIIYGHIKQALNDNGYMCNRADEILGSKPIMNKILNEILKSQYIIADLTDSNPNVFYELGIAHTYKDSQNIILLKQQGGKIPFDITHLNHIIYNSNNIKYLTSNIIQTLDNNKYIFGFHEALQDRNLLVALQDNKKEEFIDYLQQNLDSYIPQITDILLNDTNNLPDDTIEGIFNHLLPFLNNTITNDKEYLDGVIKFIFEILISCSTYKITDKIVYDFLYNNYLARFDIVEKDVLSYQTDLALLFATHNLKINTAMSWLIDYLMKSKSTTIDLNRYKIERFLMTTNDYKINNIIIDSIFHRNCYIREHLADICGEKRLQEAAESIAIQLLDEDNFFTASSLIEAVGKLDYSKGIDVIMKWINSREEEILATKQLFVLKHARIAISKLDKKYNTSSVIQFDEKYSDFLKDYFIL